MITRITIQITSNSNPKVKDLQNKEQNLDDCHSSDTENTR